MTINWFDPPDWINPSWFRKRSRIQKPARVPICPLGPKDTQAQRQISFAVNSSSGKLLPFCYGPPPLQHSNELEKQGSDPYQMDKYGKPLQRLDRRILLTQDHRGTHRRTSHLLLPMIEAYQALYQPRKEPPRVNRKGHDPECWIKTSLTSVLWGSGQLDFRLWTHSMKRGLSLYRGLQSKVHLLDVFEPVPRENVYASYGLEFKPGQHHLCVGGHT